MAERVLWRIIEGAPAPEYIALLGPAEPSGQWFVVVDIDRRRTVWEVHERDANEVLDVLNSGAPSFDEVRVIAERGQALSTTGE